MGGLAVVGGASSHTVLGGTDELELALGWWGLGVISDPDPDPDPDPDRDRCGAGQAGARGGPDHAPLEEPRSHQSLPPLEGRPRGDQVRFSFPLLLVLLLLLLSSSSSSSSYLLRLLLFSLSPSPCCRACTQFRMQTCTETSVVLQHPLLNLELQTKQTLNSDP